MLNRLTALPNQNKIQVFQDLSWTDYYLYYFDTFIGISQIVFDYENMPDTVNIEYLEQSFLFNGYCFYFKDEVLGDLTLAGSYFGRDVYGWPVKFVARGLDGSYTKQLTNRNCVMMYDNKERQCILNVLSIQASRLADLVVSAQANIRKQKTPFICFADDDSLLTIQNILRDINGNLPEVIAKKGFNKEDLQVWNLTAPLIVKDLREEFNALFNETLTFIGIPNVQMQKRERMITDEVQRSLGGAEANSYRRFKAREEAFKKVNKMFGTDIKVINNFWEGNKNINPDDLILNFDQEGVEENE